MTSKHQLKCLFGYHTWDSVNGQSLCCGVHCDHDFGKVPWLNKDTKDPYICKVCRMKVVMSTEYNSI